MNEQQSRSLCDGRLTYEAMKTHATFHHFMLYLIPACPSCNLIVHVCTKMVLALPSRLQNTLQGSLNLRLQDRISCNKQDGTGVYIGSVKRYLEAGKDSPM